MGTPEPLSAGEREQLLTRVRKATNFLYPARWLSGDSSFGEFDGADRALELFGVPPERHLAMMKMLRPARREFKGRFKAKLLIVMHTPAAVRDEYAHLFARLEGVCLKGDVGVAYRWRDLMECLSPQSVQEVEVRAQLRESA